MTIRSVDSAQYLQRQRTYDFDAMLALHLLAVTWRRAGRTLGTASRDLPGTYNFAGVSDPAVDAVIDALVQARGQDDFVTAVRALDRGSAAAASTWCRFTTSPSSGWAVGPT